MMLDWLRQLTSPPVFADEEKTRNGRMLNTILWASYACALLLGIAAPVVYEASTAVLFTALATFLLISGNLFLLKKGFLAQASLLFSSSIWLLMAVLASYGGGIQADAYKAQFISILMAGILVGWRVGFTFVFLSMAWGVLLIVAERQQLLPPPVFTSTDPIATWVTVGITFVMTAVWLHIATENLRRALSQLRDSNQQLQARTRELEAVRQMSVELAATLDLDSLLASTMKTAAELLEAARGGLFLYRDDEQVLELVANYHFEATPVGTKLQLGQGLAGTVWQLGQPLIIDNYREWPGNIPHLVGVIEDEAVIGTLIQHGEERLGVLAMTAGDGRSYTQHDIDLLNLFTAGAAVAIQNARLHSQQRQTEAALRDSEEAARGLLNAPIDSMLLLDRSGRIVDMNEMAAQNLGYSMAELINKVDVYDLFSPTVAQARRDMTEQVFVTGVALHYEDERNGRWFDNSVYPIFDGQGQVARIAVYARDITAQKTAEAERESLIADLEAKNEELERFTYTVSHDLKSPLVTIMGFLGFMEKDVTTGNAQRLRSDIAKVREAAAKMTQLLNDLLELSRIGRLMNPPTQIPFADIVQEALNIVSGSLSNHLVEVEVADDLPVVIVDRVRLTEVMQNLLDNAIRFMGDQPSPRIYIGVRYDQDKDQPIYFVQDNGMGIALQYHDNIFGLFNRLNPQIEGTGIGLTLVKRIVEVHGGRVWVESAVGEGATFCFTLGHIAT